MFILLALLISLTHADAILDRIKNDKHPWVEVRKSEGIVVYSKDLTESDLFAFKAKGVLKGPIESYLDLIRRVSEHKRWSPSLIDKYVVEKRSEIEVITRDVHFLPWPLTNRDLIVHNKLYLDHEEGYLVVGAHSIEHEDYPIKEDFVRARLSVGAIFLRPKSKDKTEIKLIIHIDPKGSVPHWMINEIQKNWPLKYLKGLEKQVAKHSPKSLGSKVQMMLDQLRRKYNGR